MKIPIKKFIAYEVKDNDVSTTFAIFDIYPDNRLLFYLYMHSETYEITCNMDVSAQDVGVTPTIMMSKNNSIFITERSIKKQNLTRQNNISFIIKDKTGVFISTNLNSNIQSISNSVINEALSGWNYLLMQQCDCSLYQMGFISFK